MQNLNPAVSAFLVELNHPFIAEIELVRTLLLKAVPALSENIKWNAPNYAFEGNDRITLRIMPPKKQVQLIFHRGAQKLAPLQEKVIEVKAKYWVWKENDRAVMTFTNREEIHAAQSEVAEIVQKWIEALRDT